MHDESINVHETQGSRNDLMKCHSEANNTVTPPTSMVPEQTDDVISPLNTPNNIQIFDVPRVNSRGTMQKLSRTLMDSIESGFSHD